MSSFSAPGLLFIFLAVMMKFTCSAKVSEKGRTCYAWGKDQSAVMLYNFPKPLHVKASPGSEWLCSAAQPCREWSPSVRADGAWAERTWHHQHGKTNQVIANSCWQRFCNEKYCSYTPFISLPDSLILQKETQLYNARSCHLRWVRE